MNTGRNLWKIAVPAMVLGLALGFAAWKATSVQADISSVSFPQVAHGLVPGENIRTILVNRCTRPVDAQVSVLDAAGAVVKQEDLVVAPGAMQTSEVNCGEVPCQDPAGSVLLSVDDSRSTLLRTEVSLGLTDVPCLFMAGVVVDDSTDSTTLSLDRLASNHNETLVRDTTPME